jgi:hypothetical protein
MNPVTNSAGVDVAARLAKPLPNLKRDARPRRLWVLDERSLRFVNFVGNRQYIMLDNLSENTKAHAAISRGRRCHLSQLDTRGKMSPSNVELCCHGAVRDFLAEADISKLVTFAIFR